MTSTKDHDSEPRTRIAAPSGPARATYVIEAEDDAAEDGVGEGDRTVMLVAAEELEPSLPTLREDVEDVKGATVVMRSPLREAPAPPSSSLPIVPIRPVVRPMGVRPPPPVGLVPAVRLAPPPPAVPQLAVPREARAVPGSGFTWLVASLVFAAVLCAVITGVLIARARVPAAVAAPPTVTVGAR